MRKTIDLTDDPFRKAKAEAALRGMKFKEYAAALSRQGLPAEEETVRSPGRKGPLPVVIPGGRFDFPDAVTNADLLEFTYRSEEAHDEGWRNGSS